MLTEDNLESPPEAVLPLWLDDIDGFLDQLRIEKFPIGIGGHTKVLVLLNHLQDQQIKISTWQQAHQWLAPLLCSAPEQRDRLVQILSSREAQYELEHDVPILAPQPAPAPGRASVAKKSSTWMAVLGFFVLMAIVGGAYYFWSESSNTLPDLGKVDTPVDAPDNKPKGAAGSGGSDGVNKGGDGSNLTEVNFDLDNSYLWSILLSPVSYTHLTLPTKCSV